MSEVKKVGGSMIITSSDYKMIPAFRLIPVTNDCPFVECLFNPEENVLAIIGKNKKDTFHMVPKLSDEGMPVPLKMGGTEENPFKRQRIQQESYSEYYITDTKEIEEFINMFACNAKTYDYKTILEKPKMSSQPRKESEKIIKV